jgi:hypothetical protein
MARQTCLIRQEHGWFKISIGPMFTAEFSEAATTPKQLAMAILELMQEARRTVSVSREAVVYCPDPRATLFAQGTLQGKAAAGDLQRLKFAAETVLPLDAERMAASFRLQGSQFQVCAIDHQAIVPWLSALSDHGLHFRVIAPASLLACEEWFHQQGAFLGNVLWEATDHWDLWHFTADGPQRWHHLEGDWAHRRLSLRAFAAQTGEQRWRLCNASPETIALLQAFQGVTLEEVTTDSQAVWCERAVHRLCRSSETPWFDLRDGEVAGADRYRSLRGWVVAAVLAGLSVMACLPLAWWWKSQAVADQLVAVESAERVLFEGGFPGVPVPEAVSEAIARKYLEAKGARSSGGEVAQSVSALPSLHAALIAMAGLPGLRVTSLAINNGEFQAEVGLSSFEEATALTNKLQAAGFVIDPPSMNQREDGSVSATFVGKLRSNLPTKKGGEQR